MSLAAEDLLRLYDLHARDLLGFLTRRGGDPQLSLDLLGDTFLSAFAAKDGCHATEDAQRLAWLYAIASNKLIEHHRRGVSERRALRRLSGELPRELTDAEYERIEQLADDDALHERLDAAMAMLSGEQRDAIKARVIGERSYADLASDLGISEQAARARVSRGLKVLRWAMRPAGGRAL